MLKTHNVDKKQLKIEKMSGKNYTLKKIKDPKRSDWQKHSYKCDQCEFMCPKNETLRKHTDTKHGGKTKMEVSQSECSICDDMFRTKAEYQKHKEEHLEEIEG